MNRSVNGLSLVLIISLLGLETSSQITPNSPQVSAQELTCFITNDCIAMSISESVEIDLDSEAATGGILKNWSLGGLIIERETTSQLIPVSQIKKIKFTGDVWVRDGNNYRKILDEDLMIDQQITWEDIPLTAFNFVGGSQTVLLQLKKVLSKEDWQELVDRSQKTMYVIDEIELNQNEKTMIVTATPINRIKSN